MPGEEDANSTKLPLSAESHEVVIARAAARRARSSEGGRDPGLRPFNALAGTPADSHFAPLRRRLRWNGVNLPKTGE